MVFLKKKPFYLTDEQIIWVDNIYKNMQVEERIGQLFCPIGITMDEKNLDILIDKYHIGGILFREGKGKSLYDVHKYLQKKSNIPLLIASNLEYGGNCSAIEGTYFGRQMLVAATQDSQKAYKLGKVSCKEAKAVGVNWAFAPVVDIDYNFRNPITNVRTFGNDVDTIIEMSKQYLKAAQEEVVATAVKHFPGDGVDERDQHLLTSINSIDCEEWDATYGKIYSEMIEAGTLSVMAGHIALPCYENYFSNEKNSAIIPATLSKNLLQKLLRDKLGFNGVITTDATPMIGFCSAMKRELAVPLSIENGCDIFLFNRNLDEDFQYMKKGYEQGILSEQRLEEAVKRILAMKLALQLMEKKEKQLLVPKTYEIADVQNEEHIQWAKECANQGVTLVKDSQHILPISSKKYQKVLIQILGDEPSNQSVETYIQEKLVNNGFQVDVYRNEGFEVLEQTVDNFKQRYDLILYIANVETISNKTVARIHWKTIFGLGNNTPWMTEEVPVIFMSLGNPYHLLDIPMIKTVINGYCNSEYVMDAILEKMMGRTEFKGVSPIDPFCGRDELREE